jgi:hypothetical protein
MSNETNSEHHHWQERLDQLNSLPGEIWTDKETSWERLYDRLKNKPARRENPLYWKAAASVLLILGISLLIVREKQPHAAQTGRLPLPGTVSKVPIQTPIHTSPAIVISKDPGTVSPSFPVRRATIREAGSLAKNDQHDSATVPYSVSPPDTPAIAAIAVLPPPKKIRVVSINELDRPSGEGEPKEDNREAGNMKSHFLLPTLIYNNYYSDTYIERQQSKDYLLQIKIH